MNAQMLVQQLTLSIFVVAARVMLCHYDTPALHRYLGGNNCICILCSRLYVR